MNAILHNRALLTLGIAETISNIGNWITMMALFAIIVFRGEGDVAASSGIWLAGLTPMLLASPIAGWLTDRVNRKWLMVASQLLAALPVIGLFLTDNLWLIYFFLVLQTIAIAPMYTARAAAVPSLVGEEQLTKANGFLQQLSFVVKIGAPMVGGAVVGALGAQNAMLLDVVSFFAAAAILLTLPSLPPQNRATKTEDRVTQEAPAGQSVLDVLRGSVGLQLIFTATFAVVVVMMGLDVLGALIVRDALGGNEQFFGLLIGAGGIGSVVGVLALMRRAGNGQPWRDVWMGLALLSGFTVSAAVAQGIESVTVARWVVIGGSFLGGIGNGILNVQIGTLMQLLSPATMLGRISGLFQSTLSAGQLITLLALPLLVPAVLSTWQFFAIGSVAVWLIAAAVAWQVRGTRITRPGNRTEGDYLPSSLTVVE